MNAKHHLWLSALCGFGAVLISPVNYTTIALLQTGYNLYTQSISELGAVGAPYGTFISICFFISGFFEIGCASGLYSALNRQRGALWGFILIACAGFFNSTCSGIFPLGGGASDLIHDTVSIIGKLGMIFAPFVLLTPMKLQPGWEILRKITISSRHYFSDYDWSFYSVWIL